MTLAANKVKLFYGDDYCLRLDCVRTWKQSAVTDMQLLLDGFVEETFADDQWTGVEYFRRFKFEHGDDFLRFSNGNLSWSSIDDENAQVESNWMWEGRPTGSSVYQVRVSFLMKRTGQLGLNVYLPAALPLEPENSTRLVDGIYIDPRRLVPSWFNIAYLSCDFEKEKEDDVDATIEFLQEQDPYLRGASEHEISIWQEASTGCQWSRTSNALMLLIERIRDSFGLTAVASEPIDEELENAIGKSTWDELQHKLASLIR